MLENKGYHKTLGTCSADPYFCSLASQYASVIGWNGVGHPSLPNYLAITSGSTQGCTSDSCPRGKYSHDLMQQFIAAGIPFVFYMESMPKACDTSDSGSYVVHHNPPPYFKDSGCSTHDLAYPGATGLLSVLTGGTPPAFVWITPNDQNNMHSGSVSAGDKWLKANLAGVLTSSWFTAGATVIVTMDENNADSSGVPMVVISSNALGHGNIAIKGTHYTTLGTLETLYGLPLLGKATTSAALEALLG